MMTDGSKDWAKFKAQHEENEIKMNKTDTNSEDAGDESTQSSSGSSQKESGTTCSLEHPSYEDLEDKLFEVEQKSQENWNAAIRAKAELENVRRQAERDVERAHKYGNTKLIESLIPVIDSLEQALQLATKNEDSDMQDGLELTMKVFLDSLEKHGVVQIDPIGDIFNPERHEAMSMQPSKEVDTNTVLKVFQKGYELNGRVIRAARVIVAKNK